MESTHPRSARHPLWWVVILCLLAGCRFVSAGGYAGSQPSNADEALERFLTECTMADGDRLELAAHFAPRGGRSLSWLTANPRWVQMERAQLMGELRRSRSQFDPGDLKPDQRVLCEAQRASLQRSLDRLEWRGRNALLPADARRSGDDWLLVGLSPATLEGSDAFEDADALEDWFKQIEACGGAIEALTRELRVRAGKGLFAPDFAVRRARTRVREELDGGLVGLLAVLSTRLDATAWLTSLEREERRSRGITLLGSALGQPLGDLSGALEQLETQAASGRLADREEDRAYYAHRVAQATTLSLSPTEFHRHHLEQLAQLQEELGDLLPQAAFSPGLDEYFDEQRGLEEARGAGVERERVSGIAGTLDRGTVPAWKEGWNLYALEVANPLVGRTNVQERMRVVTVQLEAVATALVDTGLHWEGWSRVAALEWLEENTGMGVDRARTVMEHVLLYPGEALAGPAGLEHFHQLQTRCERRLGESFDPGALHNLVLSTGPVPLETLSLRVLLWMQQQ